MPGDMSEQDQARLEAIAESLMTDRERLAQEKDKDKFVDAYMEHSEKLQALLDEIGLGRP